MVSCEHLVPSAFFILKYRHYQHHFLSFRKMLNKDWRVFPPRPNPVHTGIEEVVLNVANSTGSSILSQGLRHCYFFPGNSILTADPRYPQIAYLTSPPQPQKGNSMHLAPATFWDIVKFKCNHHCVTYMCQPHIQITSHTHPKKNNIYIDMWC